MFWSAANVIWWLVQPSHFFSLLFGIAAILLCTRYWRKARALLLTITIFTLPVSLLPLGKLLMLPLENQYQTTLPESIAGIVILGGTSIPDITASRNQVTLGESAERLIAAIKLNSIYPEAQLVFTGGGLFNSGFSEADVARMFFEDVGLDSSEIIFESDSNSTYENALFTKNLIEPTIDQEWLLVTSALHMPRAMLLFEKLNWQVVPYPVDYRTQEYVNLKWPFQVVDRWKEFDLVTREYLALFVQKYL